MVSRYSHVMYVALGLILAGKVQAQSFPGIDDYEINCFYFTPGQAFYPSVPNPQSAEIGQLLTPWVSTDTGHECQGSIDGTEKIAMMRSDTLILRLAQGVELANIPAVMDGGQAHTVYTVPGLDGIGYILKVQQYEQNTGGTWSAVNLTPGNEQIQAGFNWSYPYEPPVQETPWEVIGASFQIALVKIDEVSQWPPPSSSIDFSSVELNVRVDIVAAGVPSPLPGDATWETLIFYADADVGGGEWDGGACTPKTSDTTHIILDPASLSEFDGYGSVAKEKYFTLSWECPPLIQAVEYEFYIASGKPSPDATQGLLPQEHPSGARGVAIQVFEDHNNSAPFIPGGNYTPIKFGAPKLLIKNANSNGIHSVIELPLKAQYYKIATDIGTDVMTAGSVEAGLRMVIQFP